MKCNKQKLRFNIIGAGTQEKINFLIKEHKKERENNWKKYENIKCNANWSHNIKTQNPMCFWGTLVVSPISACEILEFRNYIRT